MPMPYTCIEYQADGPVADLRLSRPTALNAISHTLMRETLSALDQAAWDPSVRAVILSGTGRAFSAGFDIALDEGWTGGSPLAAMDSLDRVYLGFIRRVWSFPKPLIAAVHGHCLGGACELAMACDITIASDDAVFGEPEIRFGSGPPALLMPWLVGLKGAKELLLTGSVINAARAQQLGMVNRVVPHNRLEAAARQMAELIAQVAPAAARLQKEAINATFEAMGLQTAMTLAGKLVAITDSAGSEEHAEFSRIRAEQGLRAALDWRDAQFRGLDEALRATEHIVAPATAVTREDGRPGTQRASTKKGDPVIQAEPAVIPLASVPPVPKEEAPTKVRIARLLTRQRCGTDLMLGACWMDPGEETNWWSSEESSQAGDADHYYGPVHETYFIFAGKLRLSWSEGNLECGPQDAVYLPPGHRYHLKNVGSEPAFFIYSMTPSPV
jgi:enoyl-CoA hydratase